MKASFTTLHAIFAVATFSATGCSSLLGVDDVPEPSDGSADSTSGDTLTGDTKSDSVSDTHDASPTDSSETSTTDSGSGTDSITEAEADTGSCTTNQLAALEPSVANTGDTITLEGTFCGATTVTFPGGATASATLLGTHRATVVVPAAATTGDLTMSVSGTSYGPLFFRRTSFGLGLQPFQIFDDQTNGPRQMPSLVAPRWASAAIATKGFVHVFGGFGATTGLTSVESARVEADGALGAFSTESAVTLTTKRGLMQNAAAVAGDFVYVVGGNTDTGTALDSVERAPIHADGTMGTFTLLAGVHLVHARYNHSVVVVGSSLVVIGGSTGGSPLFLDSVESAPINPDGSLGTFSEVGHLVTARESHAAAVVDGYLYVLGGDHVVGGVPALASIERAPIDGEGVLGAFVAAGSLATPRQSHMSWRLGSSLFLGGGLGDPASSTSVESSTIASDGSLGTFATVSPNALPFATQDGAVVVTGNYAYMLGGLTSGAASAAIVRAQIDGDGKLDTTVVTSDPLDTARDDHSPTVLIGNIFYAIGGDSAVGTFDNAQQATVSLDGTFGAFTKSTATTATTGLFRHSLARIGGYVYSFGGSTGSGGTDEIEQAPIKSDGTLDKFTKLTARLTQTRASHATVVVGKYVRHLGGFYGSTATSVESAVINPDGTLGAFAVETPTLTTAHTDCTAAVLGNYLYVFAGNNAGESADQTAIERIALNPDGSLSGSFSVTNHFVNARQYPLMAVIGSYLYAIGGDSYPTDTTVERATINPDGTLGAFAVVTGVSAPGRWPGLLVGNALQTCMHPGPVACAQMSLP
jgi:hypothetical protein